jgi:hydrogenase maturation protein HypF
METPQALAAFEQVIADFLTMYDAEPACIAHDLHPDYVSTLWARQAAAGGSGLSALAGVERVAVQHHHAHLASCLAENAVEGQALGVIWDGTGLGTDGSIWGGEFLVGDARRFERPASLRPFRLLGGEAAVRQPRRSALALLWAIYGEDAWNYMPAQAFEPAEAKVLEAMLARGVRAPLTTSAGRLFDGVAALAGLRHTVSFEGQAAMELEWTARPGLDEAYPIEVGTTSGEGAPLQLDWRPMVEEVAADARRGVAAGVISARFHGALATGVERVAEAVGEPTVALSGGCFQNRLLTELCCRRLRRAGFEVLIHRLVPANDGGLGLGQAAVAAARNQELPSGGERCVSESQAG